MRCVHMECIGGEARAAGKGVAVAGCAGRGAVMGVCLVRGGALEPTADRQRQCCGRSPTARLSLTRSLSCYTHVETHHASRLQSHLLKKKNFCYYKLFELTS